MLILVSPAGSVVVDPLAHAFERANMFSRAVTHATESFRLIRQHSFNEHPQLAL
jgi:hypothetical protein